MYSFFMSFKKNEALKTNQKVLSCLVKLVKMIYFRGRNYYFLTLKPPHKHLKTACSQVKSAIPGTASSPLKTAIVPVVPKTAGQPQLTLQNSGAQPTVKLIAPVVATTSSPVTTASVPTVPITSASPSTSTSPTGKYAITPQVVQQGLCQITRRSVFKKRKAKKIQSQVSHMHDSCNNFMNGTRFKNYSLLLPFIL